MVMFTRTFFIAVLLAVGSDAGSVGASSQVNQSFAGYMKAFGKNYAKGSAEHNMRENIYNKRLAEILDHNSKGLSWEMALNEFTDWTEGELLSLRGFRRPHKGDLASGFGGSSVMQLGTNIDDKSCGGKDQSCSNAQSCCGGLICGSLGVCEKPAGLTEALDYSQLATSMEILSQGPCGSCWAVAAVAAIQLQAAKQVKSFSKVLSPELVNKCAPNPMECGGQGGCEGSTPELAFDYLKTISTSRGGLTTIDMTPYTAYTSGPIPEASCSAKGASSFLQVNNFRSAPKQPVVSMADWIKVKDNEAEQVMNALTSVGPLAVAVVGGGIQGYGKGVLSKCSSAVVDHAVVMMGYGKDTQSNLLYWNIRNSWGKSWGENGFFRLRRYYTNGVATTGDPMKDSLYQGEPCEWDNDPAKGVACKDEHGHYPERTRVCGVCGIVSDVSYPTGITVDPKLLV